MIAIYRALKAVKRKVQVVFLCGHNVKLYESLKKEVGQSADTNSGAALPR
jgi:hypothetical protein